MRLPSKAARAVLWPAGHVTDAGSDVRTALDIEDMAMCLAAYRHSLAVDIDGVVSTVAS